MIGPPGLVSITMQNKRRGGRPLKDPRRASTAIAIVGSPSLKAALVASAQANERSLNQEARVRLERSFRDDEILARLDGIEAVLRKRR